MSVAQVPQLAGFGLSSEEAAQRLARLGPNELPTAAPRRLGRQVLDVLREPMLLLLLSAGTVNVLLADLLDGAVLLSFVVVVVAISVYQEHKTESALAALRDLSSPRALVVRDGVAVRVAGRDVVPGDAVLLGEGDRVPADGTLVDAVNLAVDESTLTGESVPVRKTAVDLAAAVELGEPGGDGTPWVFSGTLVVKGHGIALIGRTGARTALGRIGDALRTIEPDRTRLQREVDRLVRVLAVAGLGAAVLVVVGHGALRGDWLEAVLAGIATAMAMLPEEFPVVLTVFLAVGAWRMSQRHVLTRRAPVIETLGSATVLCVDKTGTLTTNTMTVERLIAPGVDHPVALEPLPDQVHVLAEFAVLASQREAFDPVDRALVRLGDRGLAGTEHLHTDWELVREYPLSEHLLALSHVWRSPGGDRFVIAAKGAPEAIAELCHLDERARAEVTAAVESATASGLRVLGVARSSFEAHRPLPTGQHDFDFEWLGLVALQDPVRPGAAEAVAACARAGVRTIMVTGDYPGTALAVARAVGIDTSGGVVTGPELAAMGDAELAARLRTACVFARMVPEQKLRLVRALQANGEVVGMTGDGVNDAPALKAADIGIAMGARGTDVAREAAALVVTDDDMASIADGIRQGRGIYDNLRKAMGYVIAVHVPIVGMSLVPLVHADWPLVLLPVQIAFLELIIDPACSVVFEAEQVDPRVMDQPPRRLDAAILDLRTLSIAVLQGVAVLVATLLVYAWCVLGGRAGSTTRSVVFATLVFSNLALIIVNRSWRLPSWRVMRERRNPTLRWILPAAVGALTVLLVVPAARRMFDLGPIRPADVAVALGAAAAGVAWFEVVKLRSGRGPAPPAG